MGLEVQVLGGEVQHRVGPGEKSYSSSCEPQTPHGASYPPFDPRSPLSGVHVRPRDGRG